MNEPALILTKLSPPGLPAVVVRRPRIYDRLDAHSGRLVLISAPAGFGKTVLVLDWLARERRPVAWLSVDQLDNDPVRFFAHLAASVDRLPVPGAGRAAALLRGTVPRDGTLAPTLLEVLAELGPDPVVVLDDIHELESRDILSFLEAWARAPGEGPRLVLLTRVDPPLSTGRLRMEGGLLELRERDLRFTDPESVELLRTLIPAVADEAVIRRIGERTEGWVAGLRMAAIALGEAEDPVAAAESFAGTHRYVVDYLLEEAVERQTPEMRSFLLDTSVLRRFQADTCVAVSGDPHAAARLAEADAANLFLVPLSGGGGWYRFHHLFAELLQFRLRLLEPDRMDVLNERASAWFEARGDIETALDHAARMSDPGRLLDLLDAYGFEFLARSQVATLRGWLDQVPDLLTRPYPLALAAVAWSRMLTERAPDLAPILTAIAAALERVPTGYDSQRRVRAVAQLQVLRAFHARYAGRLEEALEISEKVVTTIPDEDAFVRGLVLFNMGRTRMAMAQMPAALELLRQANDDQLRAGNLYLTLAGAGHSAAIRAQVEGVHSASRSLSATSVFAEQRGIASLPAYSTVLYQLGNVQYLADDLDTAAETFRRALELSRGSHFPEGHANALMGLARVALVRRRFEEAETLLDELAGLAQAMNVILQDSTVALERTRLALAQELAGVGPPVPPLDRPSAEDHWSTVRETLAVLGLWQAARAGDQDRTSELADRLVVESEPGQRGPALCAGLIGQIVPDEREAGRWERLDQALQLAAMRGYVRPLLDGGEPVRALLQAGSGRLSTPSARTHARLVLDRFDAHDRRPMAGDGPRVAELLTEREEEVLHHLFTGASNKAIARAMYVSVETVKTHLKNLYGKLGARDRKSAMARARELGLGARAGAPTP
jgi:LuxR family transcriptional regulator, maltose regulon positive regulatory protein